MGMGNRESQGSLEEIMGNKGEMKSEEYKRALEILIEYSQCKCILLSETDKQILANFARLLVGKK